MYASHYRLLADPFRLSPDTAFRFEHPAFVRARRVVRRALHRGEGFVAIVGPPGTGKTTLVETLLDGLPGAGPLTARMVAAPLEPLELLRRVGHAFGLLDPAADRAVLAAALWRRLAGQAGERRGGLLVVDEAQGLEVEALEELRVLVDSGAANGVPLQVILVGQDPLRDRLSAPELDRLRRRLAAVCQMTPLALEETRAYVEHRLRRVGWRREPQIQADAYVLIHRFSGGVPRRINQVCSRLLLHGAVEGRRHLDGRDLLAVLDELREERLAPAHLSDPTVLRGASTLLAASGAAAGAVDPRTARTWVHRRFPGQVLGAVRVAGPAELPGGARGCAGAGADTVGLEVSLGDRTVLLPLPERGGQDPDARRRKGLATPDGD
jgi:type II secretory pathway predicted ATPase ExeA